MPALIEGLVVFAGVYFGISLALKRGAKTRTGPAGASAEEIMRERYARREISRSEYERMREDLKEKSKTGNAQQSPSCAAPRFA